MASKANLPRIVLRERLVEHNGRHPSAGSKGGEEKRGKGMKSGKDTPEGSRPHQWSVARVGTCSLLMKVKITRKTVMKDKDACPEEPEPEPISSERSRVH